MKTLLRILGKQKILTGFGTLFLLMVFISAFDAIYYLGQLLGLYLAYKCIKWTFFKRNRNKEVKT